MTYQMRRGLRLSTGLLGLFAVAALGGCGGGGVGTNPTTAVTKTYGEVPSGTLPTITYNAGADSFTVAGSSTADLTRAASSDLPGFQAYSNGSDYIWVSSSSRDATALFGSVDNGTGKIAGSRYQRISAGTVPTSGSASYTGNYGAVLVNSAGKTQKVIKGDASLTANFGTGSVGGSITNRQYYDTPNTATASGTLNNMTLSGAALDSGGNFSGGTASGGEFSVGADTTSGGGYAGLIGGANGSQISGGVKITHDNGTGGVTTETGAFIGN